MYFKNHKSSQCGVVAWDMCLHPSTLSCISYVCRLLSSHLILGWHSSLRSLHTESSAYSTPLSALPCPHIALLCKCEISSPKSCKAAASAPIAVNWLYLGCLCLNCHIAGLATKAGKAINTKLHSIIVLAP